ncbi:MAG TPA: hypothetical protein VIL35_06365 [Vicinamibacterales bacterium]
MSDTADAGAGRALGLAPAHAAALAWLGAWVSGLAMLWLEPRQPFVRHHARASTVVLGGLTLLAVGAWVLSLLTAFLSPTLFRILAWLATIAWGLLAIAWLIGLVQALRGKWLPGFSRLPRP